MSDTALVVGRERELARVAAFLDALPQGPAGLVLEGDAGIGKTTLWNVGVRGAVARSYTVLASRPAESEATLSFAALGDLIDGVRDQVLPRLPPPQRRALEIALLIADPGGSALDQRAVAVAFLGVIRLLSASRPVLIAIDDAQWLDHASAAALEFALRRLDSTPARFLASMRTAGGRGGPGARAAVAAGSLTRVQVGPLALPAFEAAVRASTGIRFSRFTIRRLFDASGGNPFYGLELARALDRAGTEPAAGEPLPVPEHLHGVLTARLAAFPDDVRNVLLAASCVRTPTVSMLKEAYGPDAGAALQHAADEGVVGLDRMRILFAHPLLASSIYSDAAPEQRRDAHRRLSEIAPTEEERARHLALSADGPDADAAEMLGQAAAAAAARGVPAAAAELAEVAAARTPPDRTATRWRHRLDAAAFLFRAGDTARARRDLEALAEEMPPGAARAEALLILADVLLHDEGEQAAVRVLEEALGQAGADRILQARIHIGIAWACDFDVPRCASQAEAGLALAQQVGDTELTAKALVHKMRADFWLGRGLDLVLGEQAMQLERSGWPPARVEDRAESALGQCLMHADRVDDARRLLEHALLAAREQGDDSSLTLLLGYLAYLECWAGNWHAAEQYSLQCQEAGEQVEQRARRATQLAIRALVDAHLGRLDAARAAAGEGLLVAAAAQDVHVLLVLNGILGFADLSAGDLQAAEATLSAAADIADRIGLAEPAVWRFHADHIEVAVGLGDLDRAERLLERFEGRGHGTARPWTMATAARCRGLLLAARGDLPGAVEALHQAMLHHEHLPMPFELGRTLLVIGQVQRRAKRKLIARQHLQRALEIFESLPAPLWAQRARSEIARIGLPPPAPLALTATEERVAMLAAAGRTNRQIASALFLSPRTVEANLARIYRKLGVSSRAELGAAMTRLELTQPSP